MEISSRSLKKLMRKRYDELVNDVINAELNKPNFDMDGPSYPYLIAVVGEISQLDMYLKIQAYREFYSLVERLGEEKFPEYLSKSARSRLKEDLGYDEVFCFRAGISYVNINNHFIDIDLAVSIFYIQQIREFLESS